MNMKRAISHIRRGAAGRFAPGASRVSVMNINYLEPSTIIIEYLSSSSD